jgi:competence protein ComEA
LKTFLNIAIGVLIGFLAAGILWIASSRQKGAPVTILPPPTPGVITVYVNGAVATPGVYTLLEGSRVDAAIRAAGGFVPSAETNLINLAALVVDGQQIDVPGIVDTSHINAGRVNINTATATELDVLPGIGPTTAKTIVDYRLQNGPFQSIQGIQKVPGIGPATYELIKDYIMIGP